MNPASSNNRVAYIGLTFLQTTNLKSGENILKENEKEPAEASGK